MAANDKVQNTSTEVAKEASNTSQDNSTLSNHVNDIIQKSGFQNDAAGLRALSDDLQNKGVLGNLILKDDQLGQLAVKEGDGKGTTITRESLEAAYKDANTSAENKMLAQALLQRFSDISQNGDKFSIDELKGWAGLKNDEKFTTMGVHDLGDGTVTTVDSPDGQSQQVIRAKGYDGQETNYGYDKDGHLNGVSGPGGTFRRADGANYFTDKDGNGHYDIKVNDDGTFVRTNLDNEDVTLRNTNGSEVTTSKNGDVTWVTYPNGNHNQFDYDSNHNITKITETKDGKTVSYTPNPNDPHGPWVSSDGSPTGRDPKVEADGTYSWTSGDGKQRFTRHTDGKETHGDAPAQTQPVEDNPAKDGAGRVTSVKGADGSSTKFDYPPNNNDANAKPAYITHTNADGSQYTMKDNGDGTYSRQEWNALPPGQYGPPSPKGEAEKVTDVKTSPDGSFSYKRENGDVVTQKADGTVDTQHGNVDGVQRDSSGRVISDKRPDGSTSNYTYDGDSKEPKTITTTYADGSTETFTRNSSGGYDRTAKDKDGNFAGSSGNAHQVKLDQSTGNLEVTHGDVKTTINANGDRTVTNGKGETETYKFDKEGHVVSLTAKYGDTQETYTRNADGTYTHHIRGRGEGDQSDTVQNVTFNGVHDSYTVDRDATHHTTYEPDGTVKQKTDIPKGSVEQTYSPEGKLTTIKTVDDQKGVTETVDFGADGKPTQVTVRENKNPQNVQTYKEGLGSDGPGSYAYTDSEGHKIAVGQDGSRLETFMDDGVEKTSIRRPDGTTENIWKQADGNVNAVTYNDKGEIVKQANHNEETGMDTVVEQQPDGSYKKTITGEDGQPHEVTISNVTKNEETGTLEYDQAVGENGRTVHIDGSNTAHYNVVSGDNLWSITGDVLSAQLGRKPTNAEIQQYINKVAETNGISNPDLIYPDQDFTLAGIN